MPYIKKIELKGFKSFGPQTVKVVLDKGFTAITGPNGSGKTNIMDACLFALGELSTRRMRAENAAKLIFHGSEKAGLEKAKMAKVVIQFDNSDGAMPVDTTTVTVSREVYRNGQSVYRLNGRRISRVHILEILSMAAISSTSQNIIPQGTITRLTDINPMERRKIIEDLIGIAQYDAEKAQAEEKLRTADISIRTAMGRIDEVQKRLDDLERERNELLRYSFIQNEIKKFEAIKISHDIVQLNKKVEETQAQADKVRAKVEKLRELRDLRRSKRRDIESEWRKLSSEIVEEGGSQVLKVQIRIGELKSKLTELTTKISSGQASFESLKRVRENNFEQYQSIRNEIRENRLKIRANRADYDKLKAQISQKEAEHEALAQETAQLWGGLGENSREIRKLEQQIDAHHRRLAFLRSEYLKNKTAVRLSTGRLKELNARRERYAAALAEIEISLADLDRVQKEQKAQLKNLESTIERKTAQKEAVEKEISQAGKIAASAKEAVIEFVTQRELAETVAAEEKALRSIEELGELGAITGVYGRLRNLIKIDKNYRKAIVAAAAGWLDALVVKDIESAFTCAETLRKMKLGRIKIIPLEGASNPRTMKIPDRRGVNGAASSFIKCAHSNEPAVNYVFGDTLIVSDDKTAFALSNEGYRAVTVNGDLYEPGGAFESGYYRAPIDFSKIIPSETAIKSLDEAVKALQQHLSQRDSDIAAFEEEIERTKIEIARLTDFISTLDREMIRVKRSVKRTQSNVRRVEKYGVKLEKEIEAGKAQMALYRSERNSIRKELQKLQAALATLRQKTDVAHIQELEVKREKLAEEIITLRQQLGTVQTEINTRQSQFDNVLRVGYMNVKIQLSKVEQQQKKLEKEVAEALQERESLKQELVELEKSRVELSKAVFSAREESKKFTTQIDAIDTELRLLDAEYEQADMLLNQLQLSIQTYQLRLQQYLSQLRQSGYEQPLETTEKQVEDAETSIRMMQFELERIGGVNQLALSHYAEQISRYRELSLRLNELEREKQAIVQFMDEIEGKKRRVFMDAFDKINQQLKNYFSKLTGGGFAFLQLENPDEPFQGGIDMIVQFPNKPSIVVSGASGGERSVAAVAFIFALKDFTPSSFYILDEVDAHLDAFHVSKLADVLLEEAGKIQFIVITLKPEMVNKAQKVYGVYERNGVSSVISAKFLEATS
ncbi:chromosome segregation protein SMC [Candidatus Bathyarchaeota archaeon A05DMB-2]|jgi:chromosome segregation protein|nr:chromosome segregation protein SMC [Candidatus Bathyarchaeota archaeon A05DMB-2]